MPFLSLTHFPLDRFDVTPAKYIAGIITEKGVIKPDANGVIDVKAFVAKHSGNHAASSGAAVEEAKTASQTTLQVPADYTEQSVASLPRYLAMHVPKAMQVLGAASADDLDCVEMGDGNLNLVFIVSNAKTTTTTNANNKVIVKQALPYVRCVGESWPLTLKRAFFEYTALEAEKKACPEFVPDLYYFSEKDALIVMQYLAPPIQILRKGLIQGIRYPTMAADMGTFCAKTLFRTSGFSLSATALRQEVQFWSQNREMCELTEQVVFTEPYITADNNRWTSPQLDEDKKAIEHDTELKLAAAGWKTKFVTQTEALIHADLHSGSVMCAEADHQTFVIDPEFAFYGPAAFDTGAFVANLFLAYVSQGGHRPGDNEYAEWILAQIQTLWQTFEAQFIALWNDAAEHTGFAYGRQVFGDNLKACQDDYMKTMLADTLGFAGMKMLRRIVGIAHVEDLESIQDADVRAKCERRGLTIAKAFIKTSARFATIEDAIQLARDTPSE
jgi:5-methylthioribose kinase